MNTLSIIALSFCGVGIGTLWFGIMFSGEYNEEWSIKNKIGYWSLCLFIGIIITLSAYVIVYR